MSTKTVIRKKTKESSVLDLSKNLQKFSDLLYLQKESEAAAALERLSHTLKQQNCDYSEVITQLEELFTGDHELIAYTFKRKQFSGEWSEAEELYIVSTGVWNLLHRLKSSRS